MNKTHTQVLFQLLLHYCIFVNVSFAFWEAGWQRKAVYYLDNLNDFGGKSLVFWFKFSFHYHSSDDRCLMIFILTQMDYYWFPWFGYSATCWWSLVYESQGPFYCSVPFRFLFRFFREGHGDVLSPLFQGGGLLGPNPVTVGEGQGTPWMSRQLIAGPLLMAVAATQVPNAHQEQFWGSVSCSRILWHVAQFHPRGAGIRTRDLPMWAQGQI